MFYHSLNVLVLLSAVWFYVHPFDPGAPSEAWLLVAHLLTFVSSMMIAGQIFLFVSPVGNLASSCLRLQFLSTFVMLAGGFFYWVPAVSSFRLASYPLLIVGFSLFVACPLAAYGFFPSRRSWRGRVGKSGT